VVTSTSSSKLAAARNVLSSNRVVYIVLGSHPPATRWSRNNGGIRACCSASPRGTR
jgi:hypothetical protein